MPDIKSLKICFMGGSQAGIIGALTLLSKGHKIVAGVSYFEGLTQVLNFFKIPVYKNVKDKNFLKELAESDILISVHGREILGPDKLGLPKLGCFNVHPYLYKYKGANPVGRALKDRNFKGSVGVHKMEPDIDEGSVIVEEFVDVSNSHTTDEIYNKLYPYYCTAILKALDKITRGECTRKSHVA